MYRVPSDAPRARCALASRRVSASGVSLYVQAIAGRLDHARETVPTGRQQRLALGVQRLDALGVAGINDA